MALPLVVNRLRWLLLIAGLALASVSVAGLAWWRQDCWCREVNDHLAQVSEALRRQDGREALRLLDHSPEDRDLPEAHAARAEAFLLLGKDTEAVAETTRAEASLKALPQDDRRRLRLQARLHLTLGEWEAARREYEALLHKSPHCADFAVGLAEATVHAEGPGQAFTLAEGMKNRADPRLDLIAARAAALLGCPEAQKKAASRALERSEDKPLLTAEAFLFSGLANSKLGLVEKATDDLGKASKNATRNPALLADIADTRGAIEFEARNFRQARIHYMEARTLFEQRGDEDSLESVDKNLAVIAMELGDLSEDQAKTLLKLGDHCEEPGCKNLGLLLLRQGDIAGAAKLLERAYELAAASGDSSARATAACNLARVQALQLSFEAARAYLADCQKPQLSPVESLPAVCRDRAAADSSLTAHARTIEANLLFLQDDTEEARQAYEIALAQQRRLGETDSLVDSLLSLAEILLETGHLDQAWKRTEEALAVLNNDYPDRQASAQILRARAAFAHKEKEKARTLLQQAAEPAEKSKELAVRIQYRLAAAELAETPADRERARRLIDETRKELAGKHYTVLEIDSAIAAGALAFKQGDRKPLISAQEKAAAVGYMLAVARADRILNAQTSE